MYSGHAPTLSQPTPMLRTRANQPDALRTRPTNPMYSGHQPRCSDTNPDALRTRANPDAQARQPRCTQALRTRQPIRCTQDTPNPDAQALR
jgi:hypothetical protein